MMKKKRALLGSVLAVTVSSAPALAADLNTPARLQGTSPSALQNALLSAKEFGAECESVDNSTAATWNAGEFCLASDHNTSTTSFADPAVVNEAAVAGSQLPRVPLREGSSLSESRRSPSASAPMGPVCVSVGGSSAATRDEGEGGFCLASDLSTSSAGFAKFAFANSLPAAGLQFLQITFADGGSPGGSRHSPGAGAECASVGGSTAATGDGGRFCLVSDLSTSTAGFANLSVANELPVAGMQYLQVTFRDGSR
ncbi:MAG: hypothetical protein ACREXR_20850, partial [Gammaproteobacteria bacterium]